MTGHLDPRQTGGGGYARASHRPPQEHSHVNGESKQRRNGTSKRRPGEFHIETLAATPATAPGWATRLANFAAKKAAQAVGHGESRRRGRHQPD